MTRKIRDSVLRHNMLGGLLGQSMIASRLLASLEGESLASTGDDMVIFGIFKDQRARHDRVVT